MTMLQIEKDSPQTIEEARRKFILLKQNIERVKSDPAKRHGFAMYTLGYLAALLIHRLVSQEVHDQLNRELDATLEEIKKDLGL
ncbi:hypothetical protein [Pseudomonas sp. 'CRE Jenny 4']|uniref:hypothetical protein n=1 Tax=Pseudomonas sp. 'CRE Jenny 4' TaxID=3045817 RepID=UPI0025A26657|nr:hypothetical protein [Pseudomonas sp. 'CRE Jenny 4']